MEDSELKFLTKKIKKFAKKNVSEKRYSHSVRVAKMCRKLCALYGFDEDLGYFCGIAHDICKRMNDEELLALAKQDGCEITEVERENLNLLHGRAASVLLEQMFGFHNADVLEAIARHTFGKVGMGDFAKILFVADKIEPGREHITKSYLKKLYKLSLDEMLFTVLNENVDYLTKKNKKVAVQTIELLKSLEDCDCLRSPCEKKV